MTESPETPTAASDAELSKQAGDFFQSFALVFRQSGVYGLTHSVTEASKKTSHGLLEAVFEQTDSVTFAVIEGELMVNATRIATTPAIEGLIEHVAALEIANFALRQGISLDEFGNMIELLHSSPEEMQEAGGFAEVLKTLGMDHVKATRLVFQQVAEDEVVVSKKEAKGLSKDDSSEIVAFLRGEGGDVDGAKIAENVGSVATDANVLTELVMEAGATDEGASEEEQGEKIVESVGRLYDRLSNSSCVNTQKGRKDLIKTMSRLEEEIAAKLNEKGDASDEVAQNIAGAIELMIDDLRIDSLAMEYTKKRNAIDASEERILRYIKSKGEEVLQDQSLMKKLEASGISQERLNELLIKSGIMNADGRMERTAAAGELAALLSDLEGKAIAASDEGGGDKKVSAEEIGDIASKIFASVTTLSIETEQKIDEYVKDANDPDPKKKAKDKGMTRKSIVGFLAEIVQELRQPLSVVTSTIDAIKDGLLGEVSEAQVEMLSLAASSSQRLDHLIDKLLEISGLPGGLTPDEKILDKVYD